jgi:hypothetical protein
MQIALLRKLISGHEGFNQDYLSKEICATFQKQTKPPDTLQQQKTLNIGV